MSKAQNKPTHDEIVALVGDLDDTVIAEIERTGATHVEIERVVRLLTGEAETRIERRPMSPRETKLYFILNSQPAFSPDRER